MAEAQPLPATLTHQTSEYLQINRAAAAFGAILYTVVTGDSIVSALSNIIGRALNTKV
jgi:hypothetical protein